MEGLSSIVCSPYKDTQLCGCAFSFFGKNAPSSGKAYGDATLGLSTKRNHCAAGVNGSILSSFHKEAIACGPFQNQRIKPKTKSPAEKYGYVWCSVSAKNILRGWF